MSDILGGETFADGETFTADRINNDLAAAVIQPNFIGDKALVTPVSADHVVIRQASSGQLKKATVAAVNTAGGNVTSVGLTLPGEFAVAGSPITGAGTLAGTWQDQLGNRILASPADGSTDVPSFRRVVAEDLRISTFTIPAAQLDWTLGKCFKKSLGGNTTFTFVNQLDGMCIHVAIIHNTYLAHWPNSVNWANGLEPAPNLATSIYKFIVIGGVIYGWLEAVNCHA